MFFGPISLQKTLPWLSWISRKEKGGGEAIKMQVSWKRVKDRIFASLVAVLLLFISLYTYDTLPLFPVLVTAVISLAVFEYYQIAKNKGFQPVVILGGVCSVCYMIALSLTLYYKNGESLPWIVLAGSGMATFFYFFTTGTNPLANIAITTFPIIYLAVPLSLGLKLTYQFGKEGPWWFLYLILITKITDMGALFVGKLFGKTLLAPYISPKKTWEGAFGGFACALLTSCLFHYFAPISITLAESLILASVLSVFAQFGDLAESLLKRDSGKKDSSSLPGLGGFLDIVDSLVFTTPLLYIFLLLR
jgi:phosphatidate cytidylyltransferase